MLKSFEVYLTDSPTPESHIRISLEDAIHCPWHSERQNNLMKKNVRKRRSPYGVSSHTSRQAVFRIS